MGANNDREVEQLNERILNLERERQRTDNIIQNLIQQNQTSRTNDNQQQRNQIRLLTEQNEELRRQNLTLRTNGNQQQRDQIRILREQTDELRRQNQILSNRQESSNQENQRLMQEILQEIREQRTEREQQNQQHENELQRENESLKTQMKRFKRLYELSISSINSILEKNSDDFDGSELSIQLDKLLDIQERIKRGEEIEEDLLDPSNFPGNNNNNDDTRISSDL